MKRTHSSGRLKIVVLSGILLACCSSAFALNPALDVSQYAHKTWKIRDGFTKAEISSIAQTPDGYLWLGTESGLYRFDGIKNEVWHPPLDQPLPSDDIFSLLATRDGTLWIGTANGLASWKDGKLTPHPQLAGFYIFRILEDHEGTVWASGLSITAGKLCAIRTSDVQCSGGDGTLGRGAFNLFEDSKGNLWAGVKNGLWRWNPGPPKFYPLAGEPDGIQAIGEDSDGVLLVGWKGGVHRFVDGNTQPYPLPGQLRARRILRDRDGGIWIATTDRGLLHARQGKVDAFATSDGLSGDTVLTIFEDREGNVWAATRSGLDRFHDSAVATFSQSQGLSGSTVHSVFADRNGGVWLATNKGLDLWTNSQIKLVGAFDASSLFQDSSGRLWVATPFAQGYLENDRLVSISAVPGAVTGIAEDTAGSLWIAHEHAGLFQVVNKNLVQKIPWSQLGHKDHVSTMVADRVRGGIWLGFFLGGIAYFSDGQIRESYSVADGLSAGRVSDFLFDHDGSLWIATEQGLNRLKDRHITTLTSKNGLPCDTIHWIREDDAQSFWLYTACGLVRIAKSDLNATGQTMSATVFDSSDGVKNLALGDHFSPQVTKSTDGRLWFPGLDGVSMIDPNHLSLNQLAPPVHVEQFIADRTVYVSDASSRLRLPPLIRNLEIEYTALSLVAPEKIRFRYLLEGRDTVWQDAGERRQAFYTDLPPGNYRFRVIACNNSGVWNEAGTAFDFTIAPAYYQTMWFRVSIVVAVCLLLALLYQLRVRQVAGQVRARMEERLEERERIARDLHDTLLQSVQGLILKFDAVGKQIPGDQPAHEAIQKVLDRADEVLAEGRDRVRNLRTSNIPMGGLPAAFERVVEENSHDGKASFKMLVEGGVRELHPMVREEAYCIGREALINALAHSDGERIEVEIAYDPRQFRLRVRDDGQGFDPELLERGGLPDHWGLQGMRERAGRIGAELKIWSGRQTGTEVELLVPGVTAYRTRAGAKRSWFSRTLGKPRINADMDQGR